MKIYRKVLEGRYEEMVLLSDIVELINKINNEVYLMPLTELKKRITGEEPSSFNTKAKR